MLLEEPLPSMLAEPLAPDLTLDLGRPRRLAALLLVRLVVDAVRSARVSEHVKALSGVYEMAS